MKGTYDKHIKINPSAAGEASWGQVDINFEWLEEQIDDIRADIKVSSDRKQRFVRAILVEGTYPVALLEPKDHENCKLVSAFAQAGDNVGMDNMLIIQGGTGNLTERVTIKDGEKSGKVQSFKVDLHKTVGRYEKVEIIPSSVRKVIVSTEWQEI